MKKKFAFVLALIACLMFATNAMATIPGCGGGYNDDGSADVKAYSDLTATYGQGAGKTATTEYGCVTSQKTTISGDVSGMGAVNEVGQCGVMGVVDGKFTASTQASTTHAVYAAKSDLNVMTGNNDMTGVAGVSFCATGNADAYGNAGVQQQLNQSQFGPGGCQTYSGGVTINTGVGN